MADGLNRYAYVHDNPLRYTDPTGHCINGLRCDSDDVLRYVDCATGGGCNAPAGYSVDAIRRLARWTLGEHEFWRNVWSIVNNLNNDPRLGAIALNGEILRRVAINVGADWSQSYNVSEEGWRYLGDVAKVSSSFFKRSLHDLISGVNEFDLVADSNVVGGKPWWQDTSAWGGYYEWSQRIDRFLPYRQQTATDYSVRTEEVFLANPSRAWSADQFGVIGRYAQPRGLPAPAYAPEVDYWAVDLFCWFGGGAVGIC